MKKTLISLAKLTRFNEYVYFVIFTTLLGVSAAGGDLDWRFPVILIANWLAVGFAFMINDIEDAPDDVLAAEKANRNPVSAGLISPYSARIATVIIGLLSAGIFITLGIRPMIFGWISLFLGFLYSYRGIRLKTIAFIDFLSHCLMLAGLQYLSGYFSYSSVLSRGWFWPLLFVSAISVYGELFNEMRDIEGDRQARLRHTAIILGEKNTQILMVMMVGLGVFSGVITFFVIQLVPGWVLLVMAVLALIFTLPPLIKLQRDEKSIQIQQAFQKPLEQAAALAMLLYFLAPWLDQLLSLGLFN